MEVVVGRWKWRWTGGSDGGLVEVAVGWWKWRWAGGSGGGLVEVVVGRWKQGCSPWMAVHHHKEASTGTAHLKG